MFDNNCWKSAESVAYLIEIDNISLLHTADSAVFSDQLEAIDKKIDYCFVACFESNFDDYLNFVKTISPKVTIPYHFAYGTEDSAKKLVVFLQINGISVRYVGIGEEFGLS